MHHVQHHPSWHLHAAADKTGLRHPPLSHVMIYLADRVGAEGCLLVTRRRHVASITRPCYKVHERVCAAQCTPSTQYTTFAPHTDYDAHLECNVATSDARCPATSSSAGQPCTRVRRLPICQGGVHQDLYDETKKA